MKPQVYIDPRPAEHFTRYHEHVRARRPDWVYDLARVILTPFVVLFYRTRCIDSDKVPARGPAIVAPNHFSFLDHFFVAVYLRRKVQFMAKSQLFKGPFAFILRHGCAFPVQRGQRDEESFVTAHSILAREGVVLMYPEGGRSRSGALGEPKPGLGRLALESGVPVIPTAIVGSQRARNWKRLQFPKVTIHYGDPIRFERVESPSREQAHAAAEVVFERVKELYDALNREDGRRRTVEAARARRAAAAG